MKFIIIVLGFAVLLATAGYFFVDKESKTLNDKTRLESGLEFTKTPNGFVHYEQSKAGSSTRVILIHGLSSPMQTWDHQYSTLVDSGFSVLRYDLFGRGYSDRPNSTYNLDLFCEQLDHLLTSLDINFPVDLVGLSLGSHIAAEFALKHTSKVRKIILLNPQITALKSPLLEWPLIGEYLMMVKVIPGLKHFQEQQNYRGFRRALLSTIRQFAGIDPIKKYAALSKSHPVALIWGNQDKNTQLFHSPEIQSALADIEFYAVDDAGHAAHFTSPEKVNTFIINFLKTVD